MIAQTGKGRLVFWPLLPTNAEALSKDGTKGITDHITLEASCKSHVTSFDVNGDRNHYRRDWSLYEHPGSGLSWWFNVLMTWSLIREQERVLEVSVRTPATDADRRKDEFRKFAERLTNAHVQLPPGPEGNFVCCAFYLQTQPHIDLSFMSSAKFFGQNVDNFVSGLPDGTKFSIQATMLAVGESKLVVAAATAPGDPEDDILIGFPMPRQASG
jgi:hypothetical protein